MRSGKEERRWNEDGWAGEEQVGPKSGLVGKLNVGGEEAQDEKQRRRTNAGADKEAAAAASERKRCRI